MTCTTRFAFRTASAGCARSPGFRRVFVALAGILDHPLFGYGPDRFERVNDDAVRTQLHPMLTAGDEPSADVLRVEAWAAVAPFLVLAASEREYCERLQLGQFQPELLFPEGGGSPTASGYTRHFSGRPKTPGSTQGGVTARRRGDGRVDGERTPAPARRVAGCERLLEGRRAVKAKRRRAARPTGH